MGGYGAAAADFGKRSMLLPAGYRHIPCHNRSTIQPRIDPISFLASPAKLRVSRNSIPAASPQYVTT